jgi:hypothetical protein
MGLMMGFRFAENFNNPLPGNIHYRLSGGAGT